MKKLLLLLAVLCGTVSGWAQNAVMPTASDAPTNEGWAAKTTWYTIKTGGGNYFKSDVADENGNLKLTYNTKSEADAALWCIVGDDSNGYQFYNKAKGTTVVLGTTGSEGNARASFVDKTAVGANTINYFFKESAKSGYWCVRIDKDGQNYWNKRSNYLALWNSDQAVWGYGHSEANPGNGDDGSALIFEVYPVQVNLEENGSGTTIWTTDTWKTPTATPDAVKEVEANTYSGVDGSNIHSRIMNVTVPAGYMRVTLNHTSGSNRLDILGVDLLDGSGNVVVSDYHFGFSGGNKVGNVYTLPIENSDAYTLRYWVTFSREANTSSGNIILNHLNVLPIESIADFKNNKVYTVTPADNANTGVWDVKSDGSKLSISRFVDGTTTLTPGKTNQQFAFLTVNDETYLYSYGTGKFVVNNSGQSLTDELSENCKVELLASTVSNKALYPAVVKVGENQLHSSYQNHLSGNGGIITTWDHLESPGNALSILPVDGEVDLTTATAKIETYQITREKAKLQTLLEEANTHKNKTYLGDVKISALTAAIAAAQTVYENSSATYAEITEQISAITAAINAAAYVNTAAEFSNNSVYTFVSNRNATAYMMYDPETPDYVASKWMKTTLETGDDNVNCQWAVYKSSRGYYYMYNIGAQKFMGTESAANTSIPFSATPQTTGLIFKTTAVASHPIMFSTNNGTGVANHSNNGFEGKNKAGLVNWDGGYGYNQDPGNVHKVTIVGEIDEEILNTITAAVELYETKGIAIQELDTYLDELYANYYDAWGSGWRNQPGVNNYSQPAEDKPINEAYAEVREYCDALTVDDTNTAEQINEKKTYLEGLESRMTINQPEVNNFYRLRCVAGQNYLSSSTSAVSNTDNDIRFEMDGQDASNPDLMFLYTGSALLSYSQGLYINNTNFNEVEVQTAVEFSEAANGKIGQYNIFVNAKYIYGQGNTKNNHIDIGANKPTSTSTNGYNWWLEHVTTLPFTFKAAGLGYATFNAPVAVELPENVKAYVGEIQQDGTTLQMWRIENGVIPANTAVLLYNSAVAEENVTVNLNIVADNEETGAIKGKNSFVGTVAAENLNAEKNCYSLQVNSSDETKVGFYNKTEGTKGGFKGWLETDKEQGVRTFTVIFDGDNATGIKEALGLENENVEIYDLSGRRLDKPAHGVNIIGGKTVIVR
ncbi:MAG: hypothetical protein IKL71_03870 [Bacteroidaceae bacterium]|nr:hypothetical protein [Bacteroidaceae bacterium]